MEVAINFVDVFLLVEESEPADDEVDDEIVEFAVAFDDDDDKEEETAERTEVIAGGREAGRGETGATTGEGRANDCFSCSAYAFGTQDDCKKYFFNAIATGVVAAGGTINALVHAGHENPANAVSGGNLNAYTSKHSGCTKSKH